MEKYSMTIDPASGIAAGYLCEQPQEKMPLWQLSIALPSNDEGMGKSFSACVVGASGINKEDAITRGAGEAVERYALNKQEGRDPIAAKGSDLGLSDITPSLVNSGLLGYSFLETREDDQFYTAKKLGTEERYRINAAAIDYPATSPSNDIDATSSGAASEFNLDRAFCHAIYELVERDAFERAWHGITTPSSITFKDLLKVNNPPKLVASLEFMKKLGSINSFQLATLDSAANIPTVLAVYSTGEGVYGIGASAGDSIVGCAVKAMIESIQVEYLLRNWKKSSPNLDTTARTSPMTEIDRLAYLTTNKASRSIEEFCSRFVNNASLPLSNQSNRCEDLAIMLKKEGIELYGVDLTPRLPEKIRNIGWNAVRVIPTGLQVLRCNHSFHWNWCKSRFFETIPNSEDEAISLLERTPPHPIA